jgi:hypothetical protein
MSPSYVRASFRHFGVIRNGPVVILKHASERLAAREQRTRSINGLIFRRERFLADFSVIFRVEFGNKEVHSGAPFPKPDQGGSDEKRSR